MRSVGTSVSISFNRTCRLDAATLQWSQSCWLFAAKLCCNAARDVFGAVTVPANKLTINNATCLRGACPSGRNTTCQCASLPDLCAIPNEGCFNVRRTYNCSGESALSRAIAAL